jgi:hypothetical protein
MADLVEEKQSPEDLLKLLEWAEKCGAENLSEHLKSLEQLKADSAKTLTILNAAGAATLAFVIKNLDHMHFSGATVGAGFMLFYLFVLSGFLVTRCLVVKEAPMARNEPQNLIYIDQLFSNALREEIGLMGERIAMVRERNDQLASDLNRVRFSALWSPAIFLLGFIIKQLAG